MLYNRTMSEKFVLIHYNSFYYLFLKKKSLLGATLIPNLCYHKNYSADLLISFN